MRINGNSFLNGIASGGERRRTGGSGERFTLEEGESAGKPEQAGGLASVSTVDALLALQSVEGHGGRGARTRHGNDMLDLLEAIKVEMLGGAVSAGKLQRLADNLEQRPERLQGEPVEEVLDAIEVRARVELAKLGCAG